MFIDFNEHPRDKVIETDVCVIGAGAAGIALVHSLSKSSLDVCLLESGSLSTQSVYQQLKEPSERKGDFFTAGCLLRQWGGTTNHWGGNSKPLDDIDFARRDWVDHSGWPIDKATLDPWYAEANELVGGGLLAYTRASMTEGEWPFPETGDELVDEVYWRVADEPTQFASIYRDSFAAAENVRVFINATVTKLAANETALAVETADVQSLDGNRATVKARFFVVAAGCMESARILLASNDVQSAGLGNEHDNVGRFFMMHPHVDVGKVTGLNPSLERLFRRHRHGGAEIIAGLSPSPAAQAQERILNAGIQLQGVVDEDSGYAAFRNLSRDLRRYYRGRSAGFPNVELDERFGDWVGAALKDLDTVIAGLWEAKDDPSYQGPKVPGIANIYVQSEQAPNRDSRVYLGTEKDPLGIPRAIQECRVLPIDKQTLRVTGELLGRSLGMTGSGRVQLAEWLLDDDVYWDTQIWGGCHHMGTTRMSARPQDGVVNADCRLHSVDNTFVASGAVFPTGGHANPTMNVVALTLRLADHLKSLAA